MHYGKLRLFTDPLFRRCSSITYFDVDHVVTGPVRLPQPPYAQPVIMTAKGCHSATGRHREFFPGVSAAADALPSLEFDRKARCFSTRTMSIDPAALPSVSHMKRRISRLTDLGFRKASRFWEQGFVQALFWNSSAPYSRLEEHRLSRGLVHLYHNKCMPLDAAGRCPIK